MAKEDDKAAQRVANCLIDLPPQNEGETSIELDLVMIIWALVSNKAKRLNNMVVVKDSVIRNQIGLRIARSGADDSWEITWR